MPTSVGRSLTPSPSQTHVDGPPNRSVPMRLALNFPGPLLICCSCLCPEFALPLSVWLDSSWIGLLLHWQAELRTACRLENPMCRPERHESTV
jgi:hypothetical protein